ncbi:hypothetical protein HK102_009703 [Quaeritorhiza haematococci]|nr:hypothetical protein HK102_009703 [Quaeritorhiza haematococci]
MLLNPSLSSSSGYLKRSQSEVLRRQDSVRSANRSKYRQQSGQQSQQSQQQQQPQQPQEGGEVGDGNAIIEPAQNDSGAGGVGTGETRRESDDGYPPEKPMMEGGSTDSTPTFFQTVPRRRGSSGLGANKAYGDLSAEELQSVQLKALKHLNAILKGEKQKTIDSSVLRSINQAAYGLQKRKWWGFLKKSALSGQGKDEVGVKNVEGTVLHTLLCRSIAYASMPYNPTDHVFNKNRIPILVYECARLIKSKGLTSNGLFRVNGSERRIAALIAIFDQAPKYGLDCKFENCTVYDVADFLKKYLRGLPEPLLSTDLYPYFLKCMDLTVANGVRLRALRLLIMLLPPPHLVLLECLLDLFHCVVQHSGANQMNSHNLARIFSPNLLRPKTATKQPLDEYERCAHVVEFLIDNWDQFVFTRIDLAPMKLIELTFIDPPVVAMTSPQRQLQPVRSPSPVHDPRTFTSPNPPAPQTPTSPPPQSQPYLPNVVRSSSISSTEDRIVSTSAVTTTSVAGTTNSNATTTPQGGVRRTRTAPTKRARGGGSGSSGSNAKSGTPSTPTRENEATPE